jgi:hypothetical protein
MRRLLIVALALLLAGSAAGASAGSTTRSPLSLGSFAELSGAATTTIGGGPDGQRVRFLPHARFALGLVLRNTSHAPVVLTAADVVEPPRTLVRQVGALFHGFTATACSAGSCPAPTFRIGSGKSKHPRPFRVAPGRLVGVELDFRLGSCADVLHASSTPISRLRVVYRSRGIAVRQHVFVLGSDSLRLRMPKPEDCTFPRSTLFVNDPSHIGTSYYFTLPGSRGDVCTNTGHGLVFRSRAYKNNDRRPERVEIRFPHFAGTGSYRDAIAAVVVDGRTVFDAAATARVTKATSHEVFARVRADRLRSQAGTVPWRIYGWMRCRVAG